MKNSNYIIITLIVSSVLILGILVGKIYFSSEYIKQQKQCKYEQEYQQASDQQAKEDHRIMEDAVKNLNNTR